MNGNKLGGALIMGIAPTPGFKGGNFKFWLQLQKQLAKDGPKSVLKSLASFESKLAEHQQKLPNLIYKSSVEREIRTFEESINTIKEFIKTNSIKP
jgi:hypothetical protein